MSITKERQEEEKQRSELNGQDRDAESSLSQLQSAYRAAKRIKGTQEKLDPKENLCLESICFNQNNIGLAENNQASSAPIRSIGGRISIQQKMRLM